MNGSLGSSHWSTRRFLYSAGELLYPHAMLRQVTLILPRSFCHSSLPFMSRQYSPSAPKKATRRLPSVTSVVFACEAFSWRTVPGLAVRMDCSHFCLPDFLSKH